MCDAINMIIHEYDANSQNQSGCNNFFSNNKIEKPMVTLIT